MSQPLYTNVATVGHTEEIVRIQFGFTDGKQTMIVAHLFTSPGHLKRLARVFQQQVERYEREHGPISDGSIELAKSLPGERVN